MYSLKGSTAYAGQASTGNTPIYYMHAWLAICTSNNYLATSIIAKLTRILKDHGRENDWGWRVWLFTQE